MLVKCCLKVQWFLSLQFGSESRKTNGSYRNLRIVHCERGHGPRRRARVDLGRSNNISTAHPCCILSYHNALKQGVYQSKRTKELGRLLYVPMLSNTCTKMASFRWTTIRAHIQKIKLTEDLQDIRHDMKKDTDKLITNR